MNSSNSNDIMEVDESIAVLTGNQSDSEHKIVNPIVKSEPVDSVDLLLDDELRLQIEKSIELVVEEFSRNTDCLTENLACDDDNDDETDQRDIATEDTNVPEIDPVQEQSSDNLEENQGSATEIETVPGNSTVSSSCVKTSVVVELPPKIPNDITVIPINTNKTVNIKSEPRDAVEADRRFKKFLNESISSTNESNAASSKGIYLPSLTSGKNSALTILPVSASTSKPVVPESTATKPKIRSDCGEFSLTADVTIKSVPSTSSSAGNPPSYKVNSSSSAMNPMLKKAYSGEMNIQQTNHGVSANIRSSSLPNNHLGLPITPPQMYPDSGVKSDTPFNPKYCSYKAPSVAASNSMADLASCSYSSSGCLSKSCSVPHSMPGPSAALTQCQQSSSLALMPYSSQPSPFCGSNFNSYAPTSSPLSSPKHLKPPINALNSCRMSSSSPVPAYMRSREPSYSAPILCDSFSSANGLISPETPSFRSTPPWNTPPSSSFRSPTSPANFNFALPSPTMGPIAPPPPPQSQSNPPMFPPCSSQSNALVLPTGHHQKSAQNSPYPFRSNFTPSFNPNSSFQRAQCCFSSQIQCFNSACASSSQQQFSIVQHSTRLSNLKSNSIDSVSSLLQYHTYFKKY